MQLADRPGGRHPAGQVHSAIHLVGVALEISHLPAYDRARVTHRYTTNESLHENMFAGEAAIGAHAGRAGRADDNPDGRRVTRVVRITPGLA